MSIKPKNPSILTKKILSQLKPGCIILLHDIKPDTVAALPDIIEGIRKEGYTLVSLDTLLPNKKPQGLIVYRSQYNQSPLKSTAHVGVLSTESLSQPIEPVIVTEISHW